MNTVLVIDDNNEYREDLMEILQFENYETFGAENGLVGLGMIDQHIPNIIVCDIDMPIMNGLTLLQTVKAHPIHAKIPFIVVSGHNDRTTMNTVSRLGAQTYLTKPIDIAQFLTTISTFCNNGGIEAPIDTRNSQTLLYEG